MTTFNELVKEHFKNSIKTKKEILNNIEIINQISKLAENCFETLKNEGKIIFAGNGGSFSDAQHLSTEFVSKFQIERLPLASIALGTNNSSISAIGNDYGFENIFSRELEAFGQKKDIFIALSTSGKSKNILQAIKKSNQMGLKSVCLTGITGGEVNKECECIKVPSNNVAFIQECHITIGHVICGIVESLMFKS